MKKTNYLFIASIIFLLTGCSFNSVNDEVCISEPRIDESLFCIDNFTSYRDILAARNDNKDVPGLSNYKIVGVNKESFLNERLYDVKSTDIKHTIKASDYGASGIDHKSDCAALVKILNKCKEYGDELINVEFEKGDYDFVELTNFEHPNTGIHIEDLSNIVFSGNGSTFYFHGDIDAFNVLNCENLYFRDINIDWAVPPFSVGTLVEKSNGQVFKIKINDGYKVNQDSIIGGYVEYDDYTLTPRAEGNDIYGDVQSTSYDEQNNILTIVFKKKYHSAPRGTYAVLRHSTYQHPAFDFIDSKNIHFESVNVYTCGGFASSFTSCENIYLNRFNTVLKTNSGRLMTSTADAIHCMDCLGEILVTNSMYENCGDDAINVHGAFWQINKIISRNSFDAVNPKGYNFPANVNDTIEIRNNDAIVLQTLTVKSCVTDPVTGHFIVTTNEDLVHDVEKNNYVDNVTRSPSLTFCNNVVRNKRCRGVLAKTNHVTISNNTFSYCASAILLGSDVDDWYESLPPSDVLITNNKFIKLNLMENGCKGDILFAAYAKGGNDAACGTITDVTIRNNYFYNSAVSGICVASASGVIIDHNLINNTGTMAETKGKSIINSGIILSSSENIRLSYNEVIANSSSKFKHVYVGNGINVEKLDVVSNRGFDKKDLEGKVSRSENTMIKVDNLSLDSSTLEDWCELVPNDYRLTINGIANDELEEVDMNKESFELLSGIIAYSDDGLYIGFDVHDNDIRFYSSENYWSGDGVEMFFCSDTKNSDPLELVKYEDCDSLEMFMSGDQVWGNKLVQLRTKKSIYSEASKVVMNFTVKPNRDGYIGKAFIPFEIIPDVKQKLFNNEQISFCLNFSDRDADSRIQYATCYNIVEYNKYVPSKMSLLSIGGAK